MSFKASFLRGYCLFQGVEAPSFSLIFISSLLLALPGFPSAQTEGLTRNKTVEFSDLSSSTVVGSSSRIIWNLYAFSIGTCRWSWFASGAKVKFEHVILSEVRAQPEVWDNPACIETYVADVNLLLHMVMVTENVAVLACWSPQ